MLAEEVLHVWNDLYKGFTPPSIDVFLETYFIMNDIKETLDSDIVKLYSPDWNDTLVTVEQLSQLCPQVR